MNQDNTRTSSLPYLELLRSQIDITKVPFSDRGSRLLVYQEAGRSRLSIKLAERLAELEPGLDAYIRRPPFIFDLSLIDESGEPLEVATSTSPDLIRSQTRLLILVWYFRSGYMQDQSGA